MGKERKRRVLFLCLQNPSSTALEAAQGFLPHTCLMHCSLSLVCWMCRSIDGNVFILVSLPGRH